MEQTSLCERCGVFVGAMRPGTYAQHLVHRPEAEVCAGGLHSGVGRTAFGSVADTPIARILAAYASSV